MKKIISLCLIVILVSLMITPSIAADINNEHETCYHSEIVDIEITPELKQKIESQIGKELGEVQTINAVCSHQWTSWRTLDYWYESPANWQDCLVKVSDQYRYCLKCNEMQARQERVQFSHNWKTTSYGRECTICGATQSNSR